MQVGRRLAMSWELLRVGGCAVTVCECVAVGDASPVSVACWCCLCYSTVSLIRVINTVICIVCRRYCKSIQ